MGPNGTTSKKRTQSRCREWERQRRNKFNEAISKLGELVVSCNKLNDAGNESDNTQYAKIDIIQKAIVYLTSFIQEKTQLKAEILALQVELETIKNNNQKKDASTQVSISFSKRKQNGQIKLMMLPKSKRHALKEKIITTNIAVDHKSEPIKSLPKQPTLAVNTRKLPIILPKSKYKNRKGPENTIVVLPASPYIFQQRPILFPTVPPPAIVLVDQNLQALNKPSVPIINRNNGDITKTTMVNILPISAYSHPLSVVKTKKCNSKMKSEKPKNSIKKIKSPKINTPSDINTNKKQNKEENESANKSDAHFSETQKDEIIKRTECLDKDLDTVKLKENEKKSTSDLTITKKDNSIINKCDIEPSIVVNTKSDYKINDKPATVEQAKNSIIEKTTKPNSSFNIDSNISIETDDIKNGNNNVKIKPPVKDDCQDKDKENKLPNILDTTLCDNVVDAGNARLELAEEFLAASPTAAFLMSFPLVSGNRADSPAEEPPNTLQSNAKDSNQKRNDVLTLSMPYYEKSNVLDNKTKLSDKSHPPTLTNTKPNNSQKLVNDNLVAKEIVSKIVTTTATPIVSAENPFLNLPMPSLISTNCTLSDTTFGLDFECSINKPVCQSSYVSNSNIFYKADPFGSVKNTIYSTSNISSGHEFNTLGLYPCAMEKYTSKNKTDFSNVEDNLMKIGSSRLTYDIDLGWSHKGFDFVNCSTAPNSFSKDNTLTSTSATYSTAYNPFNPDFHVSLVSSTSKKDNITHKPTSSFSETITNFYSQSSNLWPEDVPFYSNSNVSKTYTSKYQNYLPLDHAQTNANTKTNNMKQFDSKQVSDTTVDNEIKSSSIATNVSEKYSKKSPTKMHINWMTSEIRPMHNNFSSANPDLKELHKPTYNQMEHINKKQEHNESNYFPIAMHNIPTQEDFQVWAPTKPLGITEISIDPPPVNLPTLVGDLALGPHDKKKNIDMSNRMASQTTDAQNCSNFLSVTQLMNRSTDNSMASRFQGPIDVSKSNATKQNGPTFNEIGRKSISTRLENHVPQSCYVFNEPKSTNAYENVVQYPQGKSKVPNKSEKSTKGQKNNYSAEALIRGGSFTQKIQDTNSSKFMTPSQKYNDFIPQQDSIAQVSHFPPILDYSDNNYGSQQYPGTSLYNSTANTISNSFYTNFMSGSSNLMPSNYTSSSFTGDYMDYNQPPECNYTNHKYEELKMRNNPMYQQDKTSNYKSSRRESAAKHKLECSKKDTNKKYQNKRSKLSSEVEEWTDSSHILWQNRASNKKHSNLMCDELPFPNYVGNQMHSQYQSDLFNSHLMPSNVQSVGHNVDRSLTTFPATSRANFNLSTIFPEITMKVQ